MVDLFSRAGGLHGAKYTNGFISYFRPKELNCDRYHIDSQVVEVCELAEEISEMLGVEYDVVEDVLSWEIEFQDRDHLCEGNYLEWMCSDISVETGLDHELVYDILDAESDFFSEWH